MKAWLKGGIIGGVVYIIGIGLAFLIALITGFPDFNPVSWYIPLAIIPHLMMELNLFGCKPYVHKDIPGYCSTVDNVGLFINFLLFILIGVLIGWAINRWKENKLLRMKLK